MSIEERKPTINLSSTLALHRRDIQWTVKQWNLVDLSQKSFRSNIFVIYQDNCYITFGPSNGTKKLKVYLSNHIVHSTAIVKSFVIDALGGKLKLEMDEPSTETLDYYTFYVFSCVVDDTTLQKNSDCIVFLVELSFVTETKDDAVSTQYCCSSENFQKTILDDYDSMNKNEESLQLDNVTFIIGDASIRAHSIILTTASPYFAAIFRHANLKENKERTVDLTNDGDVTQENFKIFLDILYGRQDIENVSDEFVTQICVLADKYSVNDLLESCGFQLSRNLNNQNVIERLLFAEKYNCEYLKRKTLAYAKFYIDDVKQSPNFDDLYKNKTLLLQLL